MKTTRNLAGVTIGMILVWFAATGAFADSMTLKFAGFLPVELCDHMMIEQI